MAAIAFTVLLVVSAAPILAVAFLIGGVGVGDIFKGLGMIVLSAVMFGSVGIMISSLFRKVQAAIVVSYGFVLVLAVGTFVVLLAVAVAQAAASDDFNATPSPPKEIIAANPFVALADATASSDLSFGNNPLTGLRGLINAIETEPFNGDRFDERPEETTAIWRWYIVICVLLIYCSMYVATNRLRTPAETER